MADHSRPGEGLDPEARQTEQMPRRGPAGDTRPSGQDPDPRTRGGKPQEEVEDRPFIGTVDPEDYPDEDRAASRPDGGRPHN